MGLIWTLLPLRFLVDTTVQASVGRDQSNLNPKNLSSSKQTDDGRTALYMVLAMNQTDMAWRMVQQGADPDETVTVNGCVTSLLHVAVDRQEASFAAHLLRLGADPSKKNCKNLTVTSYAILNDAIGIVREMFSVGYDPNRIQIDSKPPLQIAVENNKPQAVLTLIQSGAKFDLTYKNGDTFLYCNDCNNRGCAKSE